MPVYTTQPVRTITSLGIQSIRTTRPVAIAPVSNFSALGGPGLPFFDGLNTVQQNNALIQEPPTPDLRGIPAQAVVCEGLRGHIPENLVLDAGNPLLTFPDVPNNWQTPTSKREYGSANGVKVI